jgi:aspartyl-tRNA synthetase
MTDIMNVKEYQNVGFDELRSELAGQCISIMGRVHSVRKSSSNLCFVILRKQIKTLQCLCIKKIMGIEKFDILTKLQKETIVILNGKITALPENQKQIKSCSYQNFEFNIDNFEIQSEPIDILPFQIEDANCIYFDEKTEDDRVGVLLPTRLDNRYFDLRTPLNNTIFKLQSEFVNGFRQYLNSNGFTEIHSPKLLGTSSESGASVFKVKYFDTNAFLAQSPQLYKQMAINADFKKVFEIGPVFRAEKSFSNRHLCEFTGLDIEMELDSPFDYKQIISCLWSTLQFMFNHIETNCKEYVKYLKSKHHYENFVCPMDPLVITFTEGVKLLQTKGFEQQLNEDLSTENEKELGVIVKNLTGSDLFVLSEYPVEARPFYTKRSDDPKFTRSYDVIMRGQEICSGSQRENDYKTLTSQITASGLNLEPLTDYLNSFKTGSPKHGGCGFGLERIVMLYFNLQNIKITSLFPRDPSRIRP